MSTSTSYNSYEYENDIITSTFSLDYENEHIAM